MRAKENKVEFQKELKEEAREGARKAWEAIEILSEQNTKLLEALKDLTTRTKRCKGILTARKGAEHSWNILDTEQAETLLASLEK